MDREAFISMLREKRELSFYIALVQKEPDILPLLFDLLEQEKSAVKYLCEKIVRRLSEQSPEALYPYFSRMAALLGSTNNFIKWGFILSVANMISIICAEEWQGVEEK